MSQPHQVYKRY